MSNDKATSTHEGVAIHSTQERSPECVPWLVTPYCENRLHTYFSSSKVDVTPLGWFIFIYIVKRIYHYGCLRHIGSLTIRAIFTDILNMYRSNIVTIISEWFCSNDQSYILYPISTHAGVRWFNDHVCAHENIQTAMVPVKNGDLGRRHQMETFSVLLALCAEN